MADGEETKVSNNDGYLSDESDFYGDSATKESFEDRASEFDDAAYWRSHQLSLTEKADVNVAQALASPPAKSTMHNPYAGQRCAWQLEESVEAFLKRLPPKTTRVSELIPWIYITNPFREAPRRIAIHEEAPPNEDGDWARCVSEGNRLLQELRTLRNTIEKENSGKSTVEIKRLRDKEKEVTVQKILDTAVDCQCTTGKWMIFCLPFEVNEIWSAIAKSTSTNSLGIGAKVAPDKETGSRHKFRLICIYTENFSDKMDVYRVLKALRELGLVDRTKRGGIYYKPDIYTYLKLDSSNPYEIKASLYSSQEFLTNPPQPDIITKPKSRPIKKENAKGDTFIRKIKT